MDGWLTGPSLPDHSRLAIHLPFAGIVFPLMSRERIRGAVSEEGAHYA